MNKNRDHYNYQVSSSSSSSSSVGGIGFLGVISAALMVLKLTDVIDISWFWVFLPVAIPFIFLIGFLLVMLAMLFKK